MNPIHGLTLTCAGRLMGWFPPETAMEAEGTGRVWFVPSTFWKITMARKPENFQNSFFFADIFDRIRQNLGFHLMLEIFHDSFLKMIIIWQLYDVMDIKKNLQIGKLWWCSIHWSWEVTYLPACILLHPFQPWRCFDFQSEWQQNTHIEKRCKRSKQEIQVSFSLDFRCQDGRWWKYQEVKQ